MPSPEGRLKPDKSPPTIYRHISHRLHHRRADYDSHAELLQPEKKRKSWFGRLLDRERRRHHHHRHQLQKKEDQKKEDEREESEDESEVDRVDGGRRRRDSGIGASEAPERGAQPDESSDPAFQPRSETSERTQNERDPQTPQDSDGDATDVMNDSDQNSHSPTQCAPPQPVTPSVPRPPQPAPPPASYASAPPPSPIQYPPRPPPTHPYSPQAAIPPVPYPQQPPPTFAGPAPTSPPMPTAQQQQADLRFIESHPAPPPRVWAQQGSVHSSDSAPSRRPFDRSAKIPYQGLPGAFVDRSSGDMMSNPPPMSASAPTRFPPQSPPQYHQTMAYAPEPPVSSPPRPQLPGAFIPRATSAPPAGSSYAYPPIQPPASAFQAAPRQPYLPGIFAYPASPPAQSAVPQPYTQLQLQPYPQPRALYGASPSASSYPSLAATSPPTPYFPSQPESPASSPYASHVNYAASPDPHFVPTTTQALTSSPSETSPYVIAVAQPRAATLAYPASNYPPAIASSSAHAFEPVAQSSQTSSPSSIRGDDSPPSSSPAASAMSAFDPQPSSMAEAASSYPSSHPSDDPPDHRFSPQPSSSAYILAAPSVRPPQYKDQRSQVPPSPATTSDYNGASDDDAFVPKPETLSRSAARPSATEGGAGDDVDSFDARQPRQRNAVVTDGDLDQADDANDPFQPRPARLEDRYDSGPDEQRARAPRTGGDPPGGPYEPQERVRDSSNLPTGEDGDSRQPGLDPESQPDAAYRAGDPDDQRDQPDSRPRQPDSTPQGDYLAQDDDGDSFTPRARSRDSDPDGADVTDANEDTSDSDVSKTSRAEDGGVKGYQDRGDVEGDSNERAASGGQPRKDEYRDPDDGGGPAVDPNDDTNVRKARSTGPSNLSDDELDADGSASERGDGDVGSRAAVNAGASAAVGGASAGELDNDEVNRRRGELDIGQGPDALHEPKDDPPSDDFSAPRQDGADNGRDAFEPASRRAQDDHGDQFLPDESSNGAFAQDQHDARGGSADMPPRDNLSDDTSAQGRDDFRDSAGGAGRDASFDDGADSRSGARNQGSDRGDDFGGAQDDFSNAGGGFGSVQQEAGDDRMDNMGRQDGYSGGQDDFRDQNDVPKDDLGGRSGYGRGGGSGYGGGRDDFSDDDFGQSGDTSGQFGYGDRAGSASDDWRGQDGNAGWGDDFRDRNDFAGGGDDFARDRDGGDAWGRDNFSDGDLQGDDWRRRDDDGFGDEEAFGAGRVSEYNRDRRRRHRWGEEEEGEEEEEEVEEEEEEEEVERARHSYDGERAQLERLLRGRATLSRLVAALSALILSCSALRYAQHRAGSRHLEAYPDASEFQLDDSFMVQGISRCERELRSEVEALQVRSQHFRHARKSYEQVKSQLADIQALQARHHQRLHRKHRKELADPFASREDKGAAAANAHYVAVHELHAARLAQAHARRHLEDCKEHGTDADIDKARDRLDQADERVSRAEDQLEESEHAALELVDALPPQHHLKIAEKKVEDAQEELDHLEKSGAPPNEVDEAKQRLAAAQEEERHARAAHETDRDGEHEKKAKGQSSEPHKTPPEEYAAAVAAVAQARRSAERHPDDPEAQHELAAAETELHHLNERHERQHEQLAAEHERLRSDPRARAQDVEEAHRRHHLSSVHEVARRRESLADAEQELYEAEKSAPHDHTRIAHLRDEVRDHRGALEKAELEEVSIRNGLHPSHQLHAAQTAHEHAVSTVSRRQAELDDLRDRGVSPAQLEHAEERLRRAQDHVEQTSHHVEMLATRLPEDVQHPRSAERASEPHNQHVWQHAALSTESQRQHQRLLRAKAEALADPENRDKQAAYEHERDAHHALTAELRAHKAHTSRAHRVQLAEAAAASAGASLTGAQESYTTALEAHQAHPTAENEHQLRIARHRLHLAERQLGEASSKLQHQRHKAAVEETARRLESLDEHASESERRDARRAHDDALRRHHHFRHELLEHRQQQVERLRRESAAAPGNEALRVELHEREEKLRRLKAKHDAHARVHPHHHPSLAVSGDSLHTEAQQHYEDVRHAAHKARHAPLSAQQQQEQAESHHAAAHRLHLSHRHLAMDALEYSRQDPADDEAQERAVQHLKRSETLRQETKRLHVQTSRSHRLHLAQSSALDAMQEAHKAEDGLDRARAEHHRHGSAESAYRLREAERHHRLALAASDDADRRVKRQQHKLLVEDARHRLEAASPNSPQHEQASRDHAAAQRQLHEHRQQEFREDEQRLATLREEARKYPTNRVLQLHLAQEQARHEHRIRKYRSREPPRARAYEHDSPNPVELPASPIVDKRAAVRHRDQPHAANEPQPHHHHHPPTTDGSDAHPASKHGHNVKHHHQPDHLVTPNPHDEYKAAVLARDHAHRRQMEADANLHAVKTAHARSPTSDFVKHLTAARLRLAVASHKNDSKSISAREHKKGTSLDARLGAARSSHVAAEKHVDEVRERHHNARERHRQAPHDYTAAVDVEKHAHHLKLAEEAHAHAARRKDHLERKRSHKHWAAEVSKANPGSEEHAYAVIRHHRATTRLIDSREAKIKHLAVELDKSKRLGGEDPSSRHHELHESLSRRFEKQRAKLAREKEEHQALSRHRSDILKNRQMSHSDDVYRRQEHERAHREEEAVRHVQDEQEREAVREEHRKAEGKRAEHLKERRKDRREEKAREKAARASKAREKAEERAKHNHEGEEQRAKKAEEKKERRANKHADWERRQKLHGEERKKADAAHAAERERKRKEKLAADAKHKEVKAAERARKAKEKQRAREAMHAEHLRHAREKEEEKRKAAAKRHREQQVKFERKRQKGKSRKAKKEARRWMKIPKVKKRKVRMPKGRKR